jgi:sugar phosphate isomerase/epimerase
MRLGASLWGFYVNRGPDAWPWMPDAVDEVLSVDEGLGVEVWASKAFEGPAISGEELVELADACQDAAYSTVHTRGEYWSWDPGHLRHEIDFAHRLRAETLVLHPVCLGLETPDDRPDWPEIVRIADYAVKFGVRLAVENIFDSIWCLDRILEEIGDDPAETNVGICIDVGHAAMSKDAGREPVRNYLERYAGQLVQLHLHDNHGQADEHLIPGLGTIDWARVLSTITAIGYEGTAVFEVQHPDLPLHDVVERSLEFLQAKL